MIPRVDDQGLPSLYLPGWPRAHEEFTSTWERGRESIPFAAARGCGKVVLGEHMGGAVF